jgi:crotonobetainyl-CoA:carnitine CoA-transferase CaiB-like acyl-CoA transferase
MQMQEASMWLARKRELNWGAFPLTGVFDTSDGALVIVGAFKANPLHDICRALGLPDLSADPDYATFAKQAENKAELHRLFRSKLSAGTTAHWLAKLEEQDLLCAPVRTIAEALADEQATINGMIMEAPGVVETVKVVGSPIHMADAPVTIRVPPATLGQHTQDVLAELAQTRATAAE